MFTIHEVANLTGLSRGQLDQMFSRLGFGEVLASPEKGSPRAYHRGAAVVLTIASELRAVGMSWADIRAVMLEHGLIFQNWLRDNTRFDEWRDALGDDDLPPIFVVFRGATGPNGITSKRGGGVQDELRGTVCTWELLRRWQSKAEVESSSFVAVDVDRVLRRVDAAIANSHVQAG